MVLEELIARTDNQEKLLGERLAGSWEWEFFILAAQSCSAPEI